MNLHEIKRYAESVARNETMSRPHMREDAAQEGLIAGWKALQDKPDASPAYVKKVIRNAIFDAVVRHHSTGSEPGRSRTFYKLKGDFDPLVVEGEYGPMLVADPADEAAQARLDTVEVDDVRASVRRAVRDLPARDREHVYLRFWQGLWAREVAALHGTTAAREAGHWNTKIRPTLASELAHLRGVA